MSGGSEGGGIMNKIWRIAGRVILALLGAVLGYQIVAELGLVGKFSLSVESIVTNNGTYGLIVGALIGFIILPVIVKRSVKFILKLRDELERIPGKDILAGIIGIVIGLSLGVLFVIAFSISSIPKFGLLIKILVNATLGYLGWNLGVKKGEEILNEILKSKLIASEDKNSNLNNCEEQADNFPTAEKISGDQEREVPPASYKILDTSVIIDGRIADICQTFFIEGVLVIPGFVLEELQHIADSSNLLRRNRGRRGLDILKKIQNEIEVPVEIYDYDFEEIEEVDSKLVKLAKMLDGKIITNDYNLNKVAELQGVTVLNINELANAVKPVVLPGEEMEVKIIKDGEEPGQGVGYLDDGTMVVVDQGKDHIGEEIEVLVTSVLQTAAGRMIFAKPSATAQQAL